jgi:hypothetical protein
MDAQLDVLIPAVRDSLCDEMGEVRAAAARAFNTLQRRIGQDAITRVVPSLLLAVEGAKTPEQAAHAMAGLQNLVTIRSAEVLPFLLPKLLAAPISDFHARALSSVAAASSSVLHAYLSTILPPLVASLSGADTKAAAKTPDAVAARLAGAVGDAAASVVRGVSDAGVSTAVSELFKVAADQTNASNRRIGCWLLERLVSGCASDYSGLVPLMLRELLHRFVDTDEEVVKAASEAVRAITVAVRRGRGRGKGLGKDGAGGRWAPSLDRALFTCVRAAAGGRAGGAC